VTEGSPSPLRLHAALFSVAFLFSINYLISKIGMRELAPLSFAWLRVAGTAIVLGLIARGEKLPEGEGRRMTLFAVTGVVLNQSLFLAGLAFTTVAVAAILITTIPVFALGTAIALGRETASMKRIAGIALAGAGALLVVGGEGFSGTWRSLAGAMMIVGNCLSYSIYLVISKPTMGRLSARAVVARMFAIGTVLMLPIAAYSLWNERWADISPRAWLALAIVIAGPSAAAYLINAWTLRHADSSLVAAYTYVQPVIASILGAVFLGETIAATVYMAAMLIFAGVWLASRSGGRTPLDAAGV
jgi:drug/metabolite transporter (DMT)-like permease